MSRPAFTSSETSQTQPLLIVDRYGICAPLFFEKTKEEFNMVMLLQSSLFSVFPKSSHLLLLPFTRRIPKLPDFVYSHIFFVFDDTNQTKQLFPQFRKKAMEDRSELIVLIPLTLFTEKLYRKIESEYARTHIIVFPDIFGKITHKELLQFIHPYFPQALKGKIEVCETGLHQAYVASLRDLIDITIRVGFTAKTAGLYYCFPKTPPTELSIAHAIHRVNPLVTIDFSQKKKRKTISYFLPSNGLYALEDPYPLERKIRESCVLEEQNDYHLESVKNHKSVSSSSFVVRSLVVSFFVILLMPLLGTIIFGFLGVTVLTDTKANLEKGDFIKSYKSAGVSSTFLTLARESSRVVMWQGNVIGQGKSVEPFYNALSLGNDIAQIAGYVSSASYNLKQVIEGKSSSPEKSYQEAMNSLKKSLTLMQKVEVEDTQSIVSNPIIQRIYGGDVVKQLETVRGLRKQLSLLGSTLDISPELLGFNTPKKYLVLFQNNMELRPGGGFIGSYGIVTVDKGKINEFEIRDVYDADGQLKGHIEPPYPIRRYLPQVHWFLRDSNFNVDYPKNASMAAFFLKEELGETVDGVIGVDVSFLQKVVDVMGPVQVRDYNQEVTGENFYLVTQTHVEKDFFPGSTQKKDFLRSLYNSLKEKFEQKNNISYLELVQVIGESIQEKHILFGFSDQTIQDVFTVNGLSSSLFDNRSKGSVIINDFLGVSEANIGINKVNYFIQRQMDYKTVIDSTGTITGTLLLGYNNTSKENVWPGGNYKNYVRIIVPLGTTLNSIAINGDEQDIVQAVTDPRLYEARNFIPPQGFEVEEYTQDNKTIYGFLVTIPPQERQTIALSYTLSQKAPVNNPLFLYSQRVFKQPGTDNYPLTTSIVYPKDFSPLKLPKEFTDNNNILTGSIIVDSDKDFTFEFSKK